MSRTKCKNGIARKDHKAISRYWGDPHPVGVCWGCKTKECSLQAAHIIPKSEGGSNAEYNINLLCPVCHAESESLRGSSYLHWINQKRYIYVSGEYREDVTVDMLKTVDDLIRMGRRGEHLIVDKEFSEELVFQILQPLMGVSNQ